MTYRSDDDTESEVIWNSRDGVTPFVITLRSGKPATHVDWRADRRVPDYQPKPDDRIFVDLTRERAKKYARRALKQHGRGAGAPTVKQLAREYMRPGAPDLIEASEWRT